MALTRKNVADLQDIHAQVRALCAQVEELYGMPSTLDSEVNQALIMLHHQLQATRWVSHNAAVTSRNHYAPGYDS